MEPLNDQELNNLLREWKAPPAPLSLEEKFFPRAHRGPWWRWLLRGSIRIPVPVAVAAAAILLLAVFLSVRNRPPAARPGGEVTLADFQPVKQLQPRIIRSAHAGN
jgi:hypothetical protein